MAIKKTQRGFALLIALIFMSVMLMFGLALGSLGYKQEVLASGALGSQYAFYVADGALECALYADQQQGAFAYDPTASVGGPAPSFSCDGAGPYEPATVTSHTATRWVLSYRFSLDAGRHCADIMISRADSVVGGMTYVFAQGYDVSCSTVANPGNARFASRGMSTRY